MSHKNAQAQPQCATAHLSLPRNETSVVTPTKRGVSLHISHLTRTRIAASASPDSPKVVATAIAQSLRAANMARLVRTYPAYVRVAFFAIAGLVEAVFTMSGQSLAPTIFASLFFLDMGMRTFLPDPADVQLCWPAAPVLFANLLWERWIHRPRGDKMRRLVKHARATALSTAVRNPVYTMRSIRQALRIARWIAWLSPLVGGFVQVKNAVGRWLVLRRQRIERAKRKRALREMRQSLSEGTLKDYFVSKIQAMYRAKRARAHVAGLRTSAQLRAKWAAARIHRIIKSRRTALLAAADSRPLRTCANSPIRFESPHCPRTRRMRAARTLHPSTVTAVPQSFAQTRGFSTCGRGPCCSQSSSRSSNSCSLQRTPSSTLMRSCSHTLWAGPSAYQGSFPGRVGGS